MGNSSLILANTCLCLTSLHIHSFDIYHDILVCATWIHKTLGHIGNVIPIVISKMEFIVKNIHLETHTHMKHRPTIYLTLELLPTSSS